MREHGKIERKRFFISTLVVVGLGCAALFLTVHDSSPFHNPDKISSVNRPETTAETYPKHKNITATVFWVGEDGNDTNKGIHNRSSAWVEDWQARYGGVDDPQDRCDYVPCSFTPKENSFYVALPYNDLDDTGNVKSSAKDIPWYTETSSRSIVKDRWIKVTYDGNVAYSQWEDVGPFGEDDFDYVFGDDAPSAPEAGIDLSPATADFLGIDGRGIVTWQFVEESEVPDGPWKTTITR